MPKFKESTLKFVPLYSNYALLLGIQDISAFKFVWFYCFSNHAFEAIFVNHGFKDVLSFQKITVFRFIYYPFRALRSISITSSLGLLTTS